MFVKSLALVATAAAAFFTVASATACEDQTAAISKLLPVLSDSNIPTCTADSGYNLLSPPGLPDDATTAKMCASTACTALIKTVTALNPLDCDLTLGSVALNVAQLVSEFPAKCAALSTTAPPASTTATPSETTATPSQTTATPSTTTTTPSTTTATPSSNTTTPSTTTAAPASDNDNAC